MSELNLDLWGLALEKWRARQTLEHYMENL